MLKATIIENGVNFKAENLFNSAIYSIFIDRNLSDLLQGQAKS
jgi:hypothetical protein